jgi:hypothetical protein
MRFHRDAVEHVDNLQLPAVELDSPQLLVGQDFLRGQFARARHASRTPHIAEGIPQRAARFGPFHREQRVDLFRVLGYTLQVCAQRGAVTLTGREFELGPGAVR